MAGASRPAIVGTDILQTAWVLAAAPAAFLPYRWRWGIAHAVALAATRSGRARTAVQLAGCVLDLDVGAARATIRELYTARLATTMDVLRGLLIGPDYAIRCRGTEHVAEALAQGRGAILWAADFPAAGEAIKIALWRAGWPLVHLSRIEHGFSKSSYGIRLLNPLRVRFENRYLAERILFDRTRPDAAKQRIRDCLRGNRVVSITASAHEGRIIAEGEFLGGRLRLAVGALRLGLATGCPVLPVFALRDRDQPERIDVTIEPPLALSAGAPEAEALACATADFLMRLETYVRRRPGAWGGWRRVGQLA
jgi:lauroyl/myristoyl acyltransferase